MEQKYDIFISHSSKDIELAFATAYAFISEGYTCGMSPHGLPYGVNCNTALIEGISGCEIFILLVTPNSVISKNVRDELDIAHRKDKRLVPVLIDDIQLPNDLKIVLRRYDPIRISSEYLDKLPHMIFGDGMRSHTKVECNLPKGLSSRHRPQKGNQNSKISVKLQAEKPSSRVNSPIPIRTKEISHRETFGVTEFKYPPKRVSLWDRLFGKREKPDIVCASAYAPAEIIPNKHFIVRIFIHKPEESSYIDRAVKDVDKSAIKKANKTLDISAKNGDKITIQLSMTDGITIDEAIQSVVWRGRYIECAFGCQLTNSNLFSLLGKAIIAINNVPCGDLKFTLDVVSKEAPKVYAPVETRRYSKIFISYAHADYMQVRGIAEGCKMNGTDYFFDRHTLQAGDIFKEKILKYIDNADLFVLCWSKNAAESEWVQIERRHALELIERGNRQLAIYPLSMLPSAPLPADMVDKYNFATL